MSFLGLDVGAAFDNTVASLGNALRVTFFGYTPLEVQSIQNSIAYGEDDQQKFFAANPGAQMSDYYAYLSGKTVTTIIQGGPSDTTGPGMTSSFKQGLFGSSLDAGKIVMVAVIAIVAVKILK